MELDKGSDVPLRVVLLDLELAGQLVELAAQRAISLERRGELGLQQLHSGPGCH